MDRFISILTAASLTGLFVYDTRDKYNSPTMRVSRGRLLNKNRLISSYLKELPINRNAHNIVATGTSLIIMTDDTCCKISRPIGNIVNNFAPCICVTNIRNMSYAGNKCDIGHSLDSNLLMTVS